jgi:transposase
MELGLNPLNTELNPICHLLALLGAHLILHISRIRVNIHLSNLLLPRISHNCNTMGGGWLKLHLLKIQEYECMAICINHSLYIYHPF